MQTVGSRAQVWHGTANHTSGGLTKKNLIKNKWGRIVSAKKHKTAKKQRRLEKAGFFAKKGAFGAVKRKTMGGMGEKVGAEEGEGDMEGGKKRRGSRRASKKRQMGGDGCKTPTASTMGGGEELTPPMSAETNK